MKTQAKIFHITTILTTASILLGGCGLADAESFFTDPEVLDQEAREDPSFWEAAVSVSGSSNLYALDNDLFLNQPYNDLYRFGDDILLIGQARYGNDTDYKYSFDIYSPWRDKIIYRLGHKDVDCDSYQVVGDELFLLNAADNTVTIYNDQLKKTGSYELTSLLSDLGEFYLPDLTFYYTGVEGKYYVEGDDGIRLLYLTDSDCHFTDLAFDYYDPIIVDNADGEKTLLYGVDPDTLQNRFAVVNNLTDSIEETYIGSWSGDVNDVAFIGQCDSNEDYWNYVTADTSTYFRYTDSQSVTLAADGSIIFTGKNYSEDDESYYLRSIDMARYAADGTLLSAMTSASSTGTDSEDFYISNHSAFFDEEMLNFSLVYSTDGAPYLLIWDMNAADSNTDEATALAMYDTEEALYLHSDHKDWATYYKDNYGLENFGCDVSEVADPDTYNWGNLTAVNEKATELEEKYGVSIYIGPEVPDTINIYSVTHPSNAGKLTSALSALDSALSCYPDGFLSQLAVGRNKGIRIYLVNSIKTDDDSALESASGFATELNDYKVMVLDVNYSYDWDYTVAHELSHMIDGRLELLASYDEDALFSDEDWLALHPEGFAYLESYQDYAGNDTYETYEEYFIDDYSVTFATEDRAVIFGNAVNDYLNNKTNDDNFKKDSPVANKYAYYCACIRDGFNTEGWDEVESWEVSLADR